MAEFRENFDFKRGDDWTVVFEMLTDGVTPLNVSARTYAMQMRTSTEATTATSFTCTVGGASNNEVTCTLGNATTVGITPSTYDWDLQETVSGVKSTIGSGKIKVSADVTRP